MSTLHVFCNCKHRLLIDLPHNHCSLLAAFRQATPTPACRLNGAAYLYHHQTHSAAAGVAVSLTVTLACSNMAPTCTTVATAPRWSATVLAEGPAFSLDIWLPRSALLGTICSALRPWSKPWQQCHPAHIASLLPPAHLHRMFEFPSSGQRNGRMRIIALGQRNTMAMAYRVAPRSGQYRRRIDET